MKREDVIQEINKVEIFSLLMLLNTELVRFDNNWDSDEYFERYNRVDEKYI